MSSSENSEVERPASIPFSGVVDSIVIHDLHALFRRRVLNLEFLLLGLGLVGIVLGAWGALAAIREEDWGTGVDWLVTFAYCGIAFVAGLEMRKGWARRLTGQEVSGAIRSLGLVIDQLDDRATWEEFTSAWIGESAALLFVSDKPHPPRVLALDGFPLHSSFFESEEVWMRVRELIRERIPEVRMVGLE